MAARKYLAIIFILMAIIVVLRLSNDYAPGIETLLSILGVIIIGWAGWAAVKDHGFNLTQAAFVGFLLSFGTHWALPIFHSIREMLFLILVNSITYALIAGIGGWMVMRFKKPLKNE